MWASRRGPGIAGASGAGGRLVVLATVRVMSASFGLLSASPGCGVEVIVVPTGERFLWTCSEGAQKPVPDGGGPGVSGPAGRHCGPGRPGAAARGCGEVAEITRSAVRAATMAQMAIVPQSIRGE